MHYSHDDLIAATGAGIGASAALANDTITCVETMAALNLDLARNVIDLAEYLVAASEALLGARNVQERFGVWNSMAQSALDKSIACSRRIFEANSNNQWEFARLIDAHFEKMHGIFVAQTETVAEGGLPGSNVADALSSSARAPRGKRAA